MSFGRIFVIVGLVIAAVGALIEFAPGLRIGRLPGDMSFGGSGWRIYLPIGTSIVLSLLLTAILWLVSYVTRR